jgi:hypothetical protein
MRIDTDHPVYYAAGTALSAAVFPRLAEVTAIAELCSYVLASVASVITIALAIKRWRDKHNRFRDSDNEQL